MKLKEYHERIMKLAADRSNLEIQKASLLSRQADIKKALLDDLILQYSQAFDSFMLRIASIEAINDGLLKAVCSEDFESGVIELQRESIGRGSNFCRTVSVDISIEPATKIIDGKAFGYIRPGVYEYPIVPDMED